MRKSIGTWSKNRQLIDHGEGYIDSDKGWIRYTDSTLLAIRYELYQSVIFSDFSTGLFKALQDLKDFKTTPPSCIVYRGKKLQQLPDSYSMPPPISVPAFKVFAEKVVSRGSIGMHNYTADQAGQTTDHRYSYPASAFPFSKAMGLRSENSMTQCFRQVLWV